MPIKPCIVVPVFRHVRLFRETAKRLSLLSLPVFVVDDGNAVEDSKELKSIADSHGFQLLRLEDNQGKGAAVMQGFRLAFEQGFTHAVQVDADGQHRIEDIPLFLEATRENPEALILGYPLFDKSAPKARVWGRKLTNLMIALETFSFKVKDGLFGFRVYPLEKSLEAAKRFFLAPGMGFDPSIAVHLCWMGTPVVNIPSPVSYNNDGYSNFRMLRDNISMTCIHIRLSLLSIPTLIQKRFLGEEKEWYQRKERGTRLALRTLRILVKLGGRRLLTTFLYPVNCYFYLTAPEVRKTSSDYSKKIKACGGKPVSPFNHLLSFSRQVIDATCAWNKSFDLNKIDWQGKEEIFALVDSGQGGLVLSAHLGCLDVARAMHKCKDGLKVTPMMYLKNARMFRTFLEELDPGSEQEFISLETFGLAAATKVSKRLEKGEFISMLADRLSASSERGIEVTFLGEKCLLPEGPFAMALSLGCPVFSFFCYRNSDQGEYTAKWQRFDIPECKTRTEKRTRMKGLAQDFASSMEEVCLKHPDQWFNFYDFWKNSKVLTKTSTSNKKLVSIPSGTA